MKTGAFGNETSIENSESTAVIESIFIACHFLAIL